MVLPLIFWVQSGWTVLAGLRPPVLPDCYWEPPRSAREAVEQAETGIHRDTSDIDQLLILRRAVPPEGRFTVRKPHECPSSERGIPVQDLPVSVGENLASVLFGRLPSVGAVFLTIKIRVLDREFDN